MVCFLQTAKDKHCLKTLARQRKDGLSFISVCERAAAPSARLTGICQLVSILGGMGIKPH